jgi:hypothetical protein
LGAWPGAHLPVEEAGTAAEVRGGVAGEGGLLEEFAGEAVAAGPEVAPGADFPVGVVDAFFVGAADDGASHDHRLGAMLLKAAVIIARLSGAGWTKAAIVGIEADAAAKVKKR